MIEDFVPSVRPSSSFFCPCCLSLSCDVRSSVYCQTDIIEAYSLSLSLSPPSVSDNHVLLTFDSATNLSLSSLHILIPIPSFVRSPARLPHAGSE